MSDEDFLLYNMCMQKMNLIKGVSLILLLFVFVACQEMSKEDAAFHQHLSELVRLSPDFAGHKQAVREFLSQNYAVLSDEAGLSEKSSQSAEEALEVYLKEQVPNVLAHHWMPTYKAAVDPVVLKTYVQLLSEPGVSESYTKLFQTLETTFQVESEKFKQQVVQSLVHHQPMPRVMLIPCSNTFKEICDTLYGLYAHETLPATDTLVVACAETLSESPEKVMMQVNECLRAQLPQLYCNICSDVLHEKEMAKVVRLLKSGQAQFPHPDSLPLGYQELLKTDFVEWLKETH